MGPDLLRKKSFVKQSGCDKGARLVRTNLWLFNNAGRFVLQRLENNQRLVNAIPRALINDDVSLARYRLAQRVASLRCTETVDQVNSRHHSDAIRQAAIRNAKSNEQAANRRARDAERQTSARRLENPDQAVNRRVRNAERQTAARLSENPDHAANKRAQNANRLAVARKRQNVEQVANRRQVNARRHFAVRCFKCCHNGKAALNNLAPYPEQLRQLLINNDTAQALNFQANIRKYNSDVAIASFGANLRPPPGHGPPCFRICGQIWYRVGGLYPPEG
ncbi:uncharacterized protein LOC130625196 [Hydractinia symbiolongicarpus]|uniref:uncharacterized protein LOC130625196 n=1 Tax=Hydractinia symbiolongicarpus TaxID=13093 RepID=UPI00254B8C1B|nr:uncharacterized protein LOC130625196 [Hydractinia symbiolongicarpus]